MARIVCPECGNEISVEAKNCPCCGIPLQFGDLICPECSSKVLYTEKEWLGDVMAIADWVITGGWNILAKTDGSKEIYFTCIKCGNRFRAG